MSERLTKLRRIMKKNELDGLLVTHDPNIRYLTDFPAKESWLLVGKNNATYITDFRYMLEAQRDVKGAFVVQYSNSIFETLFATAAKANIKRLGIEEAYVSLQRWNQLKKKAPKGIKLMSTTGIIESLRECKENKEITQIKKALAIHEESFRYLQKQVRPGLTELEICLKLEHFVKSRGVGFSFDPIVASGPNSCFPHAKVTARRIRPNDVVLIDWGIDYFGYKSDLTRMFFLGRIPKLIRTVNDTVKASQQKAINFIHANVPIDRVDYQARNYLEGHQLAPYFGHALGHGVGLEIHESPRISQRNKDLLQEGMVITVEPAVYLPNKFGIRIEDMVLVKQTKAEVLSAHIY